MADNHDARKTQKVLEMFLRPKLEELKPTIERRFAHEMKNIVDKILEFLAPQILEQAEFQNFLKNIQTEYENDSSNDLSSVSTPAECEDSDSMDNTGISDATTEVGDEDSMPDCSLNLNLLEERRISFVKNKQFPRGIPIDNQSSTSNVNASCSAIDEENESIMSADSIVVHR